MRVGGRAAWLLEPTTPDELRLAWREARERGLAPRLLGGGANLLVADGAHPWVVITTDRTGRVFRPSASADEEADRARRASAWGGERAAALAGEPVLVAWAGAPMPGLVRVARELGLAGLEGLAGVPGHLGGGLAMNAGGRWGALWDVVERVHLLTAEGEAVELDRAECAPRYRDGGLGDRVALGAVLRLRPDDPAAVRERVRAYLAEKSACQPVTEASSGCIFRNPDPELSDGRSAGRLIEDCGGKRLSRGAAVVSPKHANFVVNRGGATAADVLGLVEDVRALVAERSGVVLEREVRVWEAEPDA